MSVDTTNVFKINKEPQQKLLAYFFTKPEDITDFPIKYFVTDVLRQIAQGILDLLNANVTFTLDELTTFCKKINVKIEYNQLAEIQSAFTDFTNIDLVKKEVKEQHIRYNVFNKIVKEITAQLNQDGSFDSDKLRELSENLSERIDELENDEIFYSVEDYMPTYERILDERIKGLSRRTFGFTNLNSLITRPLTPGEISIIFALSGSFKSNFVLNIVSQLIGMKIPVLYFSLENTIEEDVLDRLIAIRENIPFEMLDNPNQDERIKIKIMNGKERLRKNEYLIMPNVPSLSTNQFDIQINRHKKLLEAKGLFKGEDKYFVTVIDMMTQLTDFKDMKPGVIEMIMNNLQIVLRKHGVPLLGVVHANENRLRGKTFKDMDELNKYFLTKEDIKYGSAIADKAKGVVISLRRLKDLKMRFFPEENEITAKDPDILDCFIVKQNKGFPGMAQFGITESLRVLPYKNDNGNGHNDNVVPMYPP